MAWDKIKAGAKGLVDKGIEAAKEKKEAERRAQEELQQRIQQMDRDGTVYCPKCYSTNITAQKRGFKFGRALVGGVLTLGVGVMAGAVGKNKIEVTCLNCGHTWKAGKR